MRREVKLEYNAQLGTWYDPRTWFEEKSGVPAVQETQKTDDFFAPGYDRVMEQQIEMEAYRKKMMLGVGVLIFALGVAIWWRKRK